MDRLRLLRKRIGLILHVVPGRHERLRQVPRGLFRKLPAVLLLEFFQRRQQLSERQRLFRLNGLLVQVRAAQMEGSRGGWLQVLPHVRLPHRQPAILPYIERRHPLVQWLQRLREQLRGERHPQLAERLLLWLGLLRGRAGEDPGDDRRQQRRHDLLIIQPIRLRGHL